MTIEEIDDTFQAVMDDISKRYRVSDELSDILSESLSEHLPKAIASAVEARESKYREAGNHCPGPNQQHSRRKA